MTLSDMIKKYKKLKQQMYMAHAKTDEEIIEAILEDLESVAKHISVDTLYTKVLEMIDNAISNDDPNEANTWTNILIMLPR